MISSADEFLNKADQTTISSKKLKNMSDTIYSILLAIGIVVAVIVGLLLGMKFITGGIEEKAEVKAMLVPYIVGCVVLFGAFTIWRSNNRYR